MSAPSPLYALAAGLPVEAPALVGEVSCETAVIGAGFTGLSAALHLAESGASVVVLDRHAPGWGASGRNGGQVNPGLKPDPDVVAQDFGERTVRAAWDAPKLVFALVARHKIDCEAAQGGTLRVATRQADLPALHRLARQCLARGMDVELLEPGAVALRTGSVRYPGALLDRRGGQLNPLAYARGLARAAQAAGVSLHGDSPALRLRREGHGWRIATPSGAVFAEHVVIATNGYSGTLLPALRRSVVPVYSAIIASQVLPEASRAAILAGREVMYELGDVTTYSRVDAAGRLLIGGRSQLRDLRGPSAFRFLARHAELVWPELRGIGWEHGWNGQLAMTTDHYPHWHEPRSGLFACLGYNGRGVAMATLLGRELARRIEGAPAAELLLPPTRLRPIPLHAGWRLAVTARLAYARMRAAAGAGR